jgi:hypothetical protein
MSTLTVDYVAKSVRNRKDAIKAIEYYDISAYDLLLKIDNEEARGEVIALMDA